MARRPTSPNAVPFPRTAIDSCQQVSGDYDPILRFDRLRIDLNRAQSFVEDAQRSENRYHVRDYFAEANGALDRAQHEVSLADDSLGALYGVLPTPDVDEVRVKVQGIRDALRGIPSASFDLAPSPAILGQLASAADEAEHLVKSLTSRAIATCLVNSMGGG